MSSTREARPKRRLRVFLGGLDNPRLLQLVRQLAVEGFAGVDATRAVAWLEELVRLPFVDRDWMERCPALEPLRGVPGFAELAEVVRAASRQVLRADLSATRTSL
ncbi:MAG: hypothetical protein H6721_01675 [Sandaracinus sp.]|nr:hypothetical protein [Sandaracinus sp.]